VEGIVVEVHVKQISHATHGARRGAVGMYNDLNHAGQLIALILPLYFRDVVQEDRQELGGMLWTEAIDRESAVDRCVAPHDAGLGCNGERWIVGDAEVQQRVGSLAKQLFDSGLVYVGVIRAKELDELEGLLSIRSTDRVASGCFRWFLVGGARLNVGWRRLLRLDVDEALDA